MSSSEPTRWRLKVRYRLDYAPERETGVSYGEIVKSLVFGTTRPSFISWDLCVPCDGNFQAYTLTSVSIVTGHKPD